MAFVQYIGVWRVICSIAFYLVALGIASAVCRVLPASWKTTTTSALKALQMLSSRSAACWPVRRSDCIRKKVLLCLARFVGASDAHDSKWMIVDLSTVLLGACRIMHLQLNWCLICSCIEIFDVVVGQSWCMQDDVWDFVDVQLLCACLILCNYWAFNDQFRSVSTK